MFFNKALLVVLFNSRAFCKRTAAVHLWQRNKSLKQLKQVKLVLFFFKLKLKSLQTITECSKDCRHLETAGYNFFIAAIFYHFWWRCYLLGGRDWEFCSFVHFSMTKPSSHKISQCYPNQCVTSVWCLLIIT